MRTDVLAEGIADCQQASVRMPSSLGGAARPPSPSTRSRRCKDRRRNGVKQKTTPGSLAGSTCCPRTPTCTMGRPATTSAPSSSSTESISNKDRGPQSRQRKCKEKASHHGSTRRCMRRSQLLGQTRREGRKHPVIGILLSTNVLAKDNNTLFNSAAGTCPSVSAAAPSLPAVSARRRLPWRPTFRPGPRPGLPSTDE